MRITAKEPAEVEFCPEQFEGFRQREIWIRIVSILVISIIFPVVAFDQPSESAGILKILLITVIRTALLWHGSMLIINFLVARYSIFKEPVKLVGLQVGFLAGFVLLVEFGEIKAIEQFLKIQLSHDDKVTIVVEALLITFLISAIYASVSFFIQWKADLQRAQALEKANLEARFETLRNQVNPHFLFNALNTLLMMVNDNPAASKYVESLSEFMRFMLNTREKEVVLLRDELKIARQYVFIQESRFGGKLTVSFNVPESCFHFAIPPLSLQMLLENALKHNVVSKDNPLLVKIFTENNQYLVVENNVQPKIEKEPSTGVGLENIRNRYLFLTGKEVMVENVNSTFIVKLPLFEKEL